MGSFVEHDALGTVSHRGIRDFSPGGHPFLGQRFQNLRRPDHRHMGRLTNPEYFFSHFRQSLSTFSITPPILPSSEQIDSPDRTVSASISDRIAVNSWRIRSNFAACR